MYKLINQSTGEEHICSKIEIDGMDYYVNDTKIYELNPDDKYYTIVENRRRVVQYSKHIQSKDAVIIATNNPNIDVPKIITVSHLANKQFDEDTKKIPVPTSLWYDSQDIQYYSFVKGYNKSQQTHPNSDEDMMEFVEWLNINEYMLINEIWFHLGHVTNLTPKELLQLWKEQKLKVIYYN